MFLALGWTSSVSLRNTHGIPQPKQPLSVASKNHCYDDNWQDKQERAFVRWLNFTISPTEQDGDSMVAQTARRESRRQAKTLYESAEFCEPFATLDAEIAAGNVAIRADRSPWADVGLREQLVSCLMSYASPWLHLGLETVFGEVIPRTKNLE